MSSGAVALSTWAGDDAIAAWIPQQPRVTDTAPSYRDYRFPREIIAHCVWTRHRGLPRNDSLMVSEVHRRSGRINNRAENSHQPTRERERRMRRFKSMRHAQRFLSTHGQVPNHFRCARHLMRACHYRGQKAKQFATWRMICGLRRASGNEGNPLG